MKNRHLVGELLTAEDCAKYGALLQPSYAKTGWRWVLNSNRTGIPSSTEIAETIALLRDDVISCGCCKAETGGLMVFQNQAGKVFLYAHKNLGEDTSNTSMGIEFDQVQGGSFND